MSTAAQADRSPASQRSGRETAADRRRIFPGDRRVWFAAGVVMLAFAIVGVVELFKPRDVYTGTQHAFISEKVAINVAQVHLRHLNPFPRDLGEILARYERVLVPEMNLGQLSLLLRGKYLVDVVGYNEVRGLPLKAAVLADVIGGLVAEAEGIEVDLTPTDSTEESS